MCSILACHRVANLQHRPIAFLLLSCCTTRCRFVVDFRFVADMLYNSCVACCIIPILQQIEFSGVWAPPNTQLVYVVRRRRRNYTMMSRPCVIPTHVLERQRKTRIEFFCVRCRERTMRASRSASLLSVNYGSDRTNAINCDYGADRRSRFYTLILTRQQRTTVVLHRK